MSLIIKGMEMPTNNDMNPTAVWVYPNGHAIVFKDNGKMKQYTEAVSVPPHGELIGREWIIDIALRLMNTAKNDDIANGVKWLWEYIIEAPTIIPAEEGE